MPYGIVTELDGKLIEKSLDLINNQNPVLMEIGVCHGGTSRGVIEYLKNKGITPTYIGVDSGKECSQPPTSDTKMYWGESTEIWTEIEERDIDWLFIDGCHCVNHVILDFLHYSQFLKSGGILVFHDVNPKAQGKNDYQGHGPKNIHFGTSAEEALNKVGLLNDMLSGWTLYHIEWDEQDYGGIAIFIKD